MDSLLFPTTIVDNFLETPEKYVELANSLEYNYDPLGRWPGTRSCDLSMHYPMMMDRIIIKIMSLFYNFDTSTDFIKFDSNSNFQKVNSCYDTGWVHCDDGHLTAIIYFCNEGFGTSLCSPKNIESFSKIQNDEQKRESYKNLNKIKEYNEYRDQNNDMFTKTVSVDSKFNRLFVFESGNFHVADNFTNQIKNDNERLTMVIFIDRIGSNKFPIQRCKMY